MFSILVTAFYLIGLALALLFNVGRRHSDSK